MLTQQEMNASADLSAIKALTFDVFGTAVDWRSGVAAEAGRIGASRGVNGDRERPADQWRGLYGPSLDLVRPGERTWTKIDHMHSIVPITVHTPLSHIVYTLS